MEKTTVCVALANQLGEFGDANALLLGCSMPTENSQRVKPCAVNKPRPHAQLPCGTEIWPLSLKDLTGHPLYGVEPDHICNSFLQNLSLEHLLSS